MSTEPKTFEEILGALEGEVTRLEQGDLPLEDALKAFENGMALSKQATQALEAAEARVEALLGEPDADGMPTTRPFEPR